MNEYTEKLEFKKYVYNTIFETLNTELEEEELRKFEIEIPNNNKYSDYIKYNINIAFRHLLARDYFIYEDTSIISINRNIRFFAISKNIINDKQYILRYVGEGDKYGIGIKSLILDEDSKLGQKYLKERNAIEDNIIHLSKCIEELNNIIHYPNRTLWKYTKLYTEISEYYIFKGYKVYGKCNPETTDELFDIVISKENGDVDTRDLILLNNE